MNDFAHEEADDKMDGSLSMVTSGAMDDEDEPMTGVENISPSQFVVPINVHASQESSSL